MRIKPVSDYRLGHQRIDWTPANHSDRCLETFHWWSHQPLTALEQRKVSRHRLLWMAVVNWDRGQMGRRIEKLSDLSVL